MPKELDLTGLRFGRWSVLYKAPNLITDSGNSFTRWHCVCDCGEERDVTTNSLRSGKSVSCGCYHEEKQRNVARNNFKTHGETKTRLYQIWAGMRKRCYNKNCSGYSNYGGRGITVCEQWNNFNSFKEWAVNNGYNDTLSIDRVDVNGNYTPDNCRWADNTTQCNNRRSNTYFNIDGQNMTLSEIARKYNKPYKTLWKKIHNGANIMDIIN